MLIKLFKHEAKSVFRLLLPLYGAALVLTGLCKLTLLFGWFGSSNLWVAIPSGLLFAGTILGLVALMFTTVLIVVLRFYKNLLGDEGYLLFTLPVTPTQLLLSKLLIGVGAVLASAVLLFGCFVFLAWGAFSFPPLPAAVWLVLPMFGICLLAGAFMKCLVFYTAVCIGPSIVQNRLAGSVIAFVAISTISSVLLFILMLGTGAIAALTGLMPALLALPETSLILLLFGGASMVFLLYGIVLFFISRHMLTKHLTLA